MRPAGGTLLRTRVSQFMNVLWRLPQHLLLKQPTPISQNLSPQAPAPGLPGARCHLPWLGRGYLCKDFELNTEIYMYSSLPAFYSKEGCANLHYFFPSIYFGSFFYWNYIYEIICQLPICLFLPNPSKAAKKMRNNRFLSLIKWGKPQTPNSKITEKNCWGQRTAIHPGKPL